MTGKQFARLLFVVFGLAIAFLAAKAFAGSGQEIGAPDLFSMIGEVFSEEQEDNFVPSGETKIFVTSTPNRPATKIPNNTEVQKVQYRAKISCDNGIYFVALRRSPGHLNKNDDVDILAEVPCGEAVLLLGDSQGADSIVWWNVSWRNIKGWMAQNTARGITILIFD